MVFCLALPAGMVTPPFGLILFTACGTTGQSFTQVVRGVIPYLAALAAAVGPAAFIPEISLFLSRLMQLI